MVLLSGRTASRTAVPSGLGMFSVRWMSPSCPLANWHLLVIFSYLFWCNESWELKPFLNFLWTRRTGGIVLSFWLSITICKNILKFGGLPLFYCHVASIWAWNWKSCVSQPCYEGGADLSTFAMYRLPLFLRFAFAHMHTHMHIWTHVQTSMLSCWEITRVRLDISHVMPPQIFRRLDILWCRISPNVTTCDLLRFSVDIIPLDFLDCS